MTNKCLSGILCFLLLSGTAYAANNPGKIALVMKALSNPFFLNMKKGAEQYAEKNQIRLDVFGVERETEITRQIGIVENLITRNYQAIVIAPADSVKLVPVCKKALESGLVVINIDNPFHKKALETHGIKIPFVGSDNRAGAEMVGQYIKNKLKEKGRAVIIEGIRGVENAELRKQGFTKGLTAGAHIEVIASETANWHKDEAFSVMTALLEKHKEIDAVLCANDNMALGVVQSLDMLGLAGKTLVGSYDNIEEARHQMRSGNIHATIEQHPELMGEYGVELAVKALSGQKIPDFRATPLDLITHESFAQTILLSISDLSNPFFAALKKGAQDAAALFGVSLIVSDAGNDDARQLVDVQTNINKKDKKVDVLIINPTDTVSVSAAIDIAEVKGVRVITVDRRSLKKDVVAAHIASDNISGGGMAGNFIANKLDGKGNILEIEGIPGTSAAHDRSMGFNQALEQYPEIRIIRRVFADFSRQKSRERTGAVLKTGVTFDAVFAHNDEMILGAIKAFDDKGLQKPRIMVGFDAADEAISAIQKGELTATIAQNPEKMGWLAVQSAIRVMRGEDLPDIINVDLKLIVRKE